MDLRKENLGLESKIIEQIMPTDNEDIFTIRAVDNNKSIFKGPVPHMKPFILAYSREKLSSKVRWAEKTVPGSVIRVYADELIVTGFSKQLKPKARGNLGDLDVTESGAMGTLALKKMGKCTIEAANKEVIWH